ncbi:hypothetical protein PIB30_040229, partial [Stylosanthes scabra]|nr:hypothetical protein [Stylosanthes scabra]
VPTVHTVPNEFKASSSGTSNEKWHVEQEQRNNDKPEPSLMKEEGWTDVCKKGNKSQSSSVLNGHKGITSDKSVFKSTKVVRNKVNRNLPDSANKKANSSKTAHGSSLQTPITFNAHKRRIPPSLQNSPVEAVQEKNNSIPTTAGVPNTKVSDTETALSALVHTCQGMSDGGAGSSVRVPSSLDGNSASAKSSELKHEPSSLNDDLLKKGDKQHGLKIDGAISN